jgi:hypothetical protein
MRGSFERDQDGQEYWLGYGASAVRLARACARKCRQEQLWDKAMIWDWWAERCAADNSKPLRVVLPSGLVTYERHSKGNFGPTPAKYWKAI